MNSTDIFDSKITVPDKELAQREATLLGFDKRYKRVHSQLQLLLSANQISEWARKYHKGILAIGERVADQYPLVVFHGDVGTGKSATAECIANKLLTEAGDEDSLVFRLSNQVRGSGKVGEMGTLLAEAFKQVVAAAGKNRRAVLIIDEGDSIAAARTQDQSHHEDKVAVNTLIQAIDDLRAYKGRIAVILCTNRLTALDPALARRAAIVETFSRPGEDERRELLTLDLAGLNLAPKQFEQLVQLTGARDDRPGWTYSDFRARLYPAALAKAFPTRALTYEDLLEAAGETKPSPVMEDR